MLMDNLEFLEEVGDPATGEPIGNTSDNLKAAIAGETHEYTDMYTEMEKLLAMRVLKRLRIGLRRLLRQKSLMLVNFKEP